MKSTDFRLTWGTRSILVALFAIIAVLGQTLVFVAPAEAATNPSWTSGPTTSVTTTSVTITGTITAASSTAITDLYICYSTTSSAYTTCSNTSPKAYVSVATGLSLTKNSNPKTYSYNATISGLTPGQTYYYYGGLKFNGGNSTPGVFGSQYSFSTSVSAITVGSTAATSIGATSATLNGNIKTTNGTSTTLDFCYSTSSTLASCSGATIVSAGTSSATTTTAVTASIAGLTGGQTYYYQLRGVQGATTAYSSRLSFTTTASGAVVTSSAATSIASSSAVLNGTVTPNSSTATSVTFCYSTSATLSSCATTDAAAVKSVTLATTYSGSTSSKVSATVSGLTAGRAYYFQVKTLQGATAVYSAPARSFTTLGSSQASSVTANSITGSSVKFSGSATANGSSADVVYCYSTSSTLNNCSTSDNAAVAFVTANESPLAANASNATVTATVPNGLNAQTTYYFQLRTTNAVGTVYGTPASFTTIGAPFPCNTNFYQVSATAPQLWTFNPQTKLFSTIGSNTKSGFNGLSYNGLNNYMYVMNSTTMYQVDSTGTFTSLGTVSGAQNIGAGFIGATNYFLTTNGSGTFARVDVSSFPLTSTPFTVTTMAGSSSWGSADLTVVPNGNGSFTAYGMTGSTLNILSIPSATSTSGVVTSKTVTSGTAGASIPSGAYGASYADQAGDVFFFNNGNSEMWEITAADLAAAGSSVVATRVTTASPKLSAANDGASCPLSVSPFGAPQPVDDSYYVTAGAGAQLNVSSLGTGFTINDQSGTTFQVSSVTFGGNTTTTQGSTLTSAAGTLTVNDLANGYFTFTPTSNTTQAVTFSYRLVQTNVVSPLTSTAGTVTIYVVQPQTVTWSPTTSLLTTQSGLPVTSATSNGNGAISYTVVSGASNTAGCSITPSTGLLTFVQAGTCSLQALAAGTSTYSAGTSSPVTITVSKASQAISWTVNQSLGLTGSSPYNFVPASGAVSSGDGNISYSVSNPGTTGCSVDSSTGQITYTSAGSCVITVTASATSNYLIATRNFTFSIGSPQTIGWSTPTNTTMQSSTFTPSNAAVTVPATNGGAITYAVTDPGSTGCAIANASSPTFTYTGAGSCQITATAATTTTGGVAYSTAIVVQTFTVSLVPQQITWSPASAFTTTQSPTTLASATVLGSAPISYVVTSAGTTGCSFANAASPVLTFTGAGTCTVSAAAAETSVYTGATSGTISITISLTPQTVTWSPTTSLKVIDSPVTPSSAATSSGTGTITYAVTNPGTTGCTVNSTSGQLFYSAAGSCSVQASAAANNLYSAATSTVVVFSITTSTQTITWSPNTSITANPQSTSFMPSTLATSTGDGPITYAVRSAGTTGCTVDANTGLVTYTGTGTTSPCQIRATAGATTKYATATSSTISFSISQIPNVVSWAPSTQNPLYAASTSTSTNIGAATALGGATVTYGYTSNTAGCSMNSSGVLSYTGTGSCVVTASSAAQTEGVGGFYSAGSISKTFTITSSALLSQAITWSPTQSITASTGKTFTPTAASVTTPSSGGGAITYTVLSQGTTGCSINSGTRLITYTATGVCEITATAAANGTYAATSTNIQFTISRATPVFSAGPITTQVSMTQAQPYNFSAWTSTSDAPVTYVVGSGVTNTAGCTVNSSTNKISFTQPGSCSILASTAQTAIFNSLSSNEVTFTFVRASQTVSWSPTTSFTANSSSPSITPSALATTSGNGAITYAVTNAGTTGCTVNSTSGVITYTGGGSCEVTATAAQTTTYNSATSVVTFVITKLSQAVTWAPTTAITAASNRIFTPSTLATSTGPGAISYAVTNAGATGCTVNPTSGAVSYSALGNCEVTATSAATSYYLVAIQAVVFTINPAPQTVTWSPTTALNTDESPYLVPASATALGGAPITYSVLSYSTLTCSVTTSSPTLTFTGAGLCTVTATAASYGIYGAGSRSVEFDVAGSPSADTYSVSDATATGATFNGAVSSNGRDSEASFCYSTSDTLTNCATTDGAPVVTTLASPNTILGTDAASEWITLPVLGTLSPATKYFFQAKASSVYGTAYGSTLSFTTPSMPIAQTVTASNIASNTSTASATINSRVDAQFADTSSQFCYSTSPTLSNCATTDSASVTFTTSQIITGVTTGVQNKSRDLTGLALGTTYYFAIKATNSVGTSYGSTLSFKTPNKPTVTTVPALEFSSSGATLQATATSNGADTNVTFCVSTGSVVDSNGVLGPCYTTITASPSSIAASNTGLVSLTGALPGTLNGTYFYQAIATNSAGTTYGAVVDLDPGAPNVGISNATSVTTTGATLNGTVNPEGNASTAWFCYSTSNEIYLTGSAAGSLKTCTATPSSPYSWGNSIVRTDTISTPLTGLQPNTAYYYQVFAHTAALGGVDVYSAIVSFTTPGPPAIDTDAVTNLASTSVVLNSTVSPGSTSTTVSFCYGTSSNLSGCTSAPVTSPATFNGSVSTKASVSVSGLTPSTRYYYVASATNANGTAPTATTLFFDTPAAPTVTTSSAVVSSSGVALSGSVNANNDPTSVVYFCYSRDASMTNCSSSTRAVLTLASTPANVSGSSPTAVTANIAPGLSAGTYYFRLAATNSSGTTFSSTLRSFTIALISQTSPLSGTVSAPDESSFSAQLAVSGNTGSVTYTQTSSTYSSVLRVSSTGVVTIAPSGLAVGTYTVTGTTSDPSGGVGTWSYTLTVTPAVIQQVAPTRGTTTVVALGSFRDQLATTGSDGRGVEFTETSSTYSNSVVVNSSGLLSVTGSLAAGSYTVSGTTRDGLGDTGTWTYTLFVTDGTLTQTGAASAVTRTPTTFTAQLSANGSNGVSRAGSDSNGVTYSQSAGSAAVVISSTGAISTTGALAVGTYVASGTMTDSLGDQGTWEFTLHVVDGTLTQDSNTLTDSTVAVNTPLPFSSQLAALGSDGLSTSGTDATGIMYSQSSGTADLLVSSSGLVTPARSLAAGIYSATGTMADSSGDTGTWSSTIYVYDGVITQIAPTSGLTNQGSAYSRQLNFTGTDDGGVTTASITSGGASGITISNSGLLSATSAVAGGTYSLTGSVGDASSNTGTWTFTLVVSALATTPSTGTTTVASSAGYTAQLSTSGNTSGSTVTYTQTSGNTNVLVGNRGAVTTTGTLAVGTYVASGTTSDGQGRSGSFSFTLTVGPGTPLVTTPTSGTATVANSAAFTRQLSTTGNTASSAVSYSKTAGPAGVVVSSSGLVSTASTLAVGSYAISGTTSDVLGEAGTFSYTLTVTAGSALVTSPSTGTVTVVNSAAFTAALSTSGNTNSSTVTYTQTTGSSSVLISSAGGISTTGILAAGNYVATGTTADELGEVGTFTYTLTVTAGTPMVTSPTTGSVTVANSRLFTASFSTTGSYGGSSVTYVQSSGSPQVVISSSGAVSTSGTLSAGTYTATGTTSNSLGQTGTYTYTLTVTGGSSLSTTPTSGSTSASSSISYSRQLSTTGNTSSSAVTYLKTAGSASLAVSSGGLVTTSGSLAAGTYAISGTTTDALGETGTFSFTLVVYNLVTSPTTATVSQAGSAAFTDQLTTSGNTGSVTYSQLIGSGNLTVSSSGAITTTGALTAGTYTASGGTVDAAGHSSTFSYTLTVTAGALSTTPTSASVTSSASGGYTGQLSTSGNSGSVTYTQTVGSSDVVVSSSGAISTTGILTVGNHVASGTTDDGQGNTGTFSFTLTVSAVPLTTTPTGPDTIVYSQWALWDVQLQTTGGPTGAIYTYSQNASGQASRLNVNLTTGHITTFGSPSDETFFVSGTVTDQFGNTGTWSYTLIDPVGTLETTPGSKTVSVSTSGASTTQLVTTGNYGSVSYTKSSGSSSLAVSSAGLVSTVGGTTLSAGDYTIGGTTIDQRGDTGTFSFVLHVLPGALSTSNASANATVPNSSAFTQTMTTSGAPVGGTVSYLQLSGLSSLSISSTGVVTTNGPLAVGTYTAIGSTSDNYGDSGTFTFTLVVGPGTLSTTPTANAGTVNVLGSTTYIESLTTSGNSGSTVTYVKTGGSSSLSISSAGRVSTSGALPIGSYTISGTTTDTLGDSGTFSYTLTITDVPGLNIRTLTVLPTGGVNTLLVPGTVAMNGSLSAGSGVIAWSAGPSSICTISSTGVVTAIASGSCVVTANTPQTGTYYAATGSYTLSITAPVNLINGPGPVVPPGGPQGPGEPGTPTPTEPSDPTAPTEPVVGISLPQPLDRTPAVGESLVTGAPPRDGNSIDAISSSTEGSRTIPELSVEQFPGFMPQLGTFVEVIGARTTSQFIVTPGEALDALTIAAAIEESTARNATSFAKVTNASAISAPAPEELVSGPVTSDAIDSFAAAHLDKPVTVGSLNTADASNWLSVSAEVKTYLPGSVVYLAVTTKPIILGAVLVGPDGTATVSGMLPADLLGAGGHNIRVVGTRELNGVTADADGKVMVSSKTLKEIKKFDAGTYSTVNVWGATPSGGKNLATRWINLDLDTPWWSIWMLLIAAGIALALRLFLRKWTLVRKVTATVIVTGFVAVAEIAGWVNYSYFIMGLAGLIGLAMIAIMWLFPKRNLRRNSRKGN